MSQWSQPITALAAVGGTSTTVSSTIETEGASAVIVHVVSASTSSASVVIEGSVDGTTFWYPLATVSNPTVAGEMWAGPAPRHLRINPSTHASGTLSAYVAFRAMEADPIGASWKLITAAPGTFAAITATSVTDSGLTATRVPFAGSGGLLADDSTMTFDSSGKVFAATVHKGNWTDVTTAKLTDGAVAAAPATYFITKGSALGSSTVANPTATTHDGYRIRFVSTTAYAHVVSFNSGKINGGSNTTVTLTSGAIGDGFDIEAFQGVWYITGTRGTVTVG